MNQSTTTTRQTKAAAIRRTITVTADREPWGVTVYATMYEQHQGPRGAKNISDVYILSRIAGTAFGLGVHVEKQLGEAGSYDVLLNAPGGGHTCNCPHGTYRGHVKPCRHIEAALQAVRERLL